MAARQGRGHACVAIAGGAETPRLAEHRRPRGQVRPAAAHSQVPAFHRCCRAPPPRLLSAPRCRGWDAPASKFRLCLSARIARVIHVYACIRAYRDAGVTNPGVRVLSQIYCECRYFWRAVDHEGEVTERLVTKVRRRKVCAEILEEIPVPHRMSAL